MNYTDIIGIPAFWPILKSEYTVYDKVKIQRDDDSKLLGKNPSLV